MTSFRDMTLAQFEAFKAQHNARTRRENRIETDFATVVQPVDDEGDLHRDILDACRRRGWIALHGSMVQRAHRLKGEWDFIVIADKGRVFLCECKAQNRKQTPEQYALHHWATSLGHNPRVIRSLEEFEEMTK